MYEVVNADDVRMRQFETAFCFTSELIKRRTILNHEIGKKFQRDIAFQLFIARQPDYSHSASPENLDQLVTAKDFLSAGKLTRRRRGDTPRALVNHFDSLTVIKMEGKLGRKLRTSIRFSDDALGAARQILYPLSHDRSSQSLPYSCRVTFGNRPFRAHVGAGNRRSAAARLGTAGECLALDIESGRFSSARRLTARRYPVRHADNLR